MHLGKDSKLRVNVGRIVQLQKVRPVRWETTGNVRNTYAKVDVKIIQSLQIFARKIKGQAIKVLS